MRNLLSCGVAMVRDRYYPIPHGEQGPRDLCWDDGVSQGAGVAAQSRHGRSFYAELSRTPPVASGEYASCDKTFGAGSKSLQLGLANSSGFSHPKDYNNTSDECVQLGCVLN